MNPSLLSGFVKGLADSAGFDRCGIAWAGPIGRGDYLHEWLRLGRGGTMEYLAKNLDKRTNSGALLPGARSIVVVAMLYNQPDPTIQGDPDVNRRTENHRRTENPFSVLPEATAGPRILSRSSRKCRKGGSPHGIGRIARYAWGEDYHVVIKDKLFDIARRLQSELAEPFEFKVCVDTAPLLEREVAAAAGIGWIGKNTMVLDHQLGSYFFLGVIITTLEIEPDQSREDHCGTCTACLDACPTGAFPAPYQMDASKCISYLTIEHRAEIAPDLRPMMGDWIFGCDICQEVCPYNRKAPVATEPRLQARPPAPGLPLDLVLSWTEEDYRTQLRGTALRRAKLEMFKRNARIVRRNDQERCLREPNDRA